MTAGVMLTYNHKWSRNNFCASSIKFEKIHHAITNKFIHIASQTSEFIELRVLLQQVTVTLTKHGVYDH